MLIIHSNCEVLPDRYRPLSFPMKSLQDDTMWSLSSMKKSQWETGKALMLVDWWSLQ